MGMGLQAASVPAFGELGTTLTMLRKEIAERATPGAYTPGSGDGLGGGRGQRGGLKLPRGAGAGPGPQATHLWIPSESLPKTRQAPHTWNFNTAPPNSWIQRFKTQGICPIQLEFSFLRLKLPGRQRSPFPLLFLHTPTPHTISSRLEKSQRKSSKIFIEAQGGQGRGQSDQKSRAGWGG